MLFTSDKIDSKEVEKFGLVLKSVPDNTLNAKVETLTEHMSRAPIIQLRLLKINKRVGMAYRKAAKLW